MVFAGITLAILFFLLSLLHFYWAFGGKWGLAKVIPVTANGGQPSINPGFLGTLAVALGLLLVAVFYANSLLGYFDFIGLSIVGWVIPSLFLLRAVGEFRYVGFFKRVVGTEFSRMDTLLFSPLCTVIAAFG